MILNSKKYVCVYIYMHMYVYLCLSLPLLVFIEESNITQSLDLTWESRLLIYTFIHSFTLSSVYEVPRGL